jgi:hypothetical protein
MERVWQDKIYAKNKQKKLAKRLLESFTEKGADNYPHERPHGFKLQKNIRTVYD